MSRFFLTVIVKVSTRSVSSCTFQPFEGGSFVSVSGITGGMQQKRENVMLVTEESERVTPEGGPRALGRRKKPTGCSGEASR